MITYIKYNNKRKKEFNLYTKFLQDGESTKVIKTPFYEDGKDFLDSLIDKNRMLAEKGLSPVEVKIENGEAIFEYLEGETLLNLISVSLNAGNFDKVDEVLSMFDSILESISEEVKGNTYSDEYIKIFGTEGNFEKYIVPGILDLNFDNLIVNKKEKVGIIDYEWVWDFPIPYEFVKFRSIFYLLSSLKGHYIKNVEYIYDKLTGITSDTLISMEANFQNYVLKDGVDKIKFAEDFKRISFNYENKDNIGLTGIVNDRNNLRSLLQKSIERNETLTEYIKQLEATLSRHEVKIAVKVSNLLKKLRREFNL